MAKPKTRIMLLLPHPMAARNILHTDILANLQAQSQAEITIISKDKPDFKNSDRSKNSIKWQQICRPFKNSSKLSYLWSDLKFLIIHILHMMVTYRFNSIHKFNGFEQRIKASGGGFLPKWNEGHALSLWFGFPFRKSKLIYNFLNRILNSSWSRHRFIRKQFDIIKPDKLFIVHIQIANIIPYIAEAQARNIPIQGMIGSWDQPSTKGSICAGISKILVCNERLKQELVAWHNIKQEKISVVGWAQMDIYYNSQPIERNNFLASIAINHEKKYILCGAYAHRLGTHEPEIFKNIAQAIMSTLLDTSLILYIRPHPLDKNWQLRFADLKKYPCVIIEPPSLGDLQHLSHLLQHSSVVLSSAGTILLDAIAHDRPAIALAYGSAEIMDKDTHIEGRYKMEHLHALMQAGAIIKATSTKTLLDAIKSSLQNEAQYKPQRNHIKKHWLEPFDGKSSQRIANEICTAS